MNQTVQECTQPENKNPNKVKKKKKIAFENKEHITD